MMRSLPSAIFSFDGAYADPGVAAADSNMEPNFLVIGGHKCGSSSLCYALERHPDVFMTALKEPQYFCREDIFARGWDWYCSLFDEAREAKAIGEGSVMYSSPKRANVVIPRIVDRLPHVKLIHIARHPLRRMESAWRHRQTAKRDERTTFDELVRRRHFISGSLYWKQISAYRQHFADDQILVVLFEEFVRNPQEVLQACCNFLDVDPEGLNYSIAPKRNASTNYRVDGQLLNAARSLRGFDWARNRLPLSLRRRLSRFIKRPVEMTPEWSQETRAKVVDELSADIERFLEYAGMPRNYWDLTE